MSLAEYELHVAAITMNPHDRFYKLDSDSLHGQHSAETRGTDRTGNNATPRVQGPGTVAWKPRDLGWISQKRRCSGDTALVVP